MKGLHKINQILSIRINTGSLPEKLSSGAADRKRKNGFRIIHCLQK